MVEIINACKILVGKPKGKDHLEELGVDGRLFKWILRNKGVMVHSGFIRLVTSVHGWLY
jgi:hypothetical protein